MIIDHDFISADETIEKELVNIKVNLINKILSGKIPSISSNKFYWAGRQQKDGRIGLAIPTEWEYTSNDKSMDSKIFCAPEHLDFLKSIYRKCHHQFNNSFNKEYRRDWEFIYDPNPLEDLYIEEKQENSQFCEQVSPKGLSAFGSYYGNRLESNYNVLDLMGLSENKSKELLIELFDMLDPILNQLKKHWEMVRLSSYPSIFFWYKGPGSGMGWHNNAQFPGYRFYFVYVDEDNKSFFHYQDQHTGEIVTTKEKKGWNIHYFNVQGPAEAYGYNDLSWHSVESHCNRISIGFKVWGRKHNS